MAESKPQPDADRKAKRKAETAEIARRVDAVLTLRLDGRQYHDILQYSSEKCWNVGERQLREYLRRADDLLIERSAKKRKPLLALHLARREVLYRRAFDAGDFRTALAVLDNEAKLRGLYPDKDVKELARLTAEQERRLAALERRQLDEVARLTGELASARAELAACRGHQTDQSERQIDPVR